MTHLPRNPNDQVATKDDIARLEGRVDRLEDRLDNRINSLQAIIIDQQKYYARTTVWSMTALTAIFSLVVAFFG